MYFCRGSIKFFVDFEKLLRMFPGPAPSLFKSKYLCIRIYYTSSERYSHFHTLRTTNTRLFNNIVVHIRNDEEARGRWLHLVCNFFFFSSQSVTFGYYLKCLSSHCQSGAFCCERFNWHQQCNEGATIGETMLQYVQLIEDRTNTVFFVSKRATNN